MSQYKCPFTEKVPLQCSTMYSLDEFIRQMEQVLDSVATRFVSVGGDSHPFVCKNNPELCPRYIQHLVKNIQTYKQR